MESLSQIGRSPESIQAETARFMRGVYRWMTIGILVTALVCYYVASTPELAQMIIVNRVIFWACIIAEFACVIFLVSFLQKMRGFVATITFLLYAALTGLTLSVIFFVYTQDSIVNAFITTACGFAGLSAFGYVTKRDLGPIGTFCSMGLWGLIGFGLLSLIFPSMMTETTDMVYSMVGIVVFAGLTAYDTQKIKAMNIIGNEGSEEDHKETILGALTLYLDFINLFLKILRLMGRRK